MKKLFTILLLLLLIAGLASCQKYIKDKDEIDDEEKNPPIVTIDLNEINPQHDVYYHLFVRSFADSNNDGIGDLNGVTQNLDYLDDLGITAIWLMPINPSPSYHGYDVTDFLAIEEDFGTMEDFQNLVDAAAELDIKIIIDLVINHTSDEHPWFIEARENPRSVYRDFYVWNDGKAFSSFPGGMKDLNMENEFVVLEIKNIMDFYLNMGVHGFRLDAVKHLFEGQDAHARNIELLKELNQHIKQNHPDSFVVSEVFDYNYENLAKYFEGTDSVFNFHVAGNIWEKVGIRNDRDLLVSNLARAYDVFRDINPEFIDSPFISNHDLNRIASMPGFDPINSTERLALAARILLTLPGNPFIYYGEELGMKGKRSEGVHVPGYGTVWDEYRRQPFMWGNLSIETNWLPSDGSNDDTKTLAQQMEDPSSLFNQYRDIIQIRRNNPALMFGNYFEAFNGNNPSIQGFVRFYEHEDVSQAVLVLHNLANAEYIINLEHLEVLFGELTIPAFGTLILEIDLDKIGDYI